MTAKEYFGQAFMAETLIRTKQQLLEKYRGREQRVTASYSPMSGYGGGGTRRPMADAADERMDVIAHLEQEIQRLKKLPEEMYQVIRNVSDARYRFILESTYLLQEPVEDIAAAMGVSKMSVYRILKEALQEAEPFIPRA